MVPRRRSNAEFLRLIGQLIDEMPSTAARAADAIRMAVPSYGRVWDQIGARVEQSIGVTNIQFLEAMRSGTQPREEALEQLARIGLPKPELGISLDDTLYAIRTSGSVLADAISEASVSHPDGGRQLLSSMVRDGFKFLNDFSTAISREGIRRERDSIQRHEDAERALLAVLLTRPTRTEEANKLARLVGIRSLGGTWFVIVAVPTEWPEHPTDALAAIVASIRRELRAAGSRETVCGIVDGEIIAISQQLPALQLPPYPGAVIGIGSAHATALGIVESWDEAQVALQVAKLTGISIARYDAIELDRVLVGSMTPSELASDLLKPFSDLPEPKRSEWLDTLDVFLASDRNFADAARSMNVHPHTIRYRLQQIEAIVALNLDSHDRRLALQIALRSRRLAAAAKPDATETT